MYRVRRARLETVEVIAPLIVDRAAAAATARAHCEAAVQSRDQTDRKSKVAAR